jgi:hypothetical protein
MPRFSTFNRTVDTSSGRFPRLLTNDGMGNMYDAVTAVVVRSNTTPISAACGHLRPNGGSIPLVAV